MRKLGTLTDWMEVPEKGLLFAAPEPRRVRLEAVSAGESCIWLADADGSLFLLGAFTGAETFEFATNGSFTITAEGSEVAVFTADGLDNVTVPDVLPDSFTRIAERRARNPELEYMQAVSLQNQMRMQQDLDEARAQQARDRAEFERRLNERLAATGANDTASTTASTTGVVPKEPAQAGGGAPTEPTGGGNGSASEKAS